MGRSRGRAAILVFQALLVSACAASPPAASPPPPPCPTIAPTPPPAPPPSVATAPPPVVLPPSIPDTPAEHALAQLFADAWDDQMREVPTLASTFGDRRFNDRWPEVSEAAFLRRRAHATDYLARLQAIPQGSSLRPSQLNRALFEREYTLAVEGYAHGFDGFSDGFKIGGSLRSHHAARRHPDRGRPRAPAPLRDREGLRGLAPADGDLPCVRRRDDLRSCGRG